MKKFILKVAGLAALLAVGAKSGGERGRTAPPVCRVGGRAAAGTVDFWHALRAIRSLPCLGNGQRTACRPITRIGGENYGIDVRQGYFTFDYGITEKWAADLNLGATTVGWRPFDNGNIQKTTGLMDTTLGVRYQIFNETNNDTGCPWLPTLTFRAGAIVPGVYDRLLAFAPGNHGVAIEPSILFREHIGWPGFGVWGDLLYRWEHTIGADQYIAAVGFFQQIKGWELDAGYRHLQTLSGEDIVLGSGQTAPGAYNTSHSAIYYATDVREISDSIDAGFSYTTSKRHWKYGFHCRKTFDGSNTDSAFWLGASLDIPLDLFTSK